MSLFFRKSDPKFKKRLNARSNDYIPLFILQAKFNQVINPHFYYILLSSILTSPFIIFKIERSDESPKVCSSQRPIDPLFQNSN